MHYTPILQNADDNSYGPGTVPAMEFLLLPGAVAALNNEAGFTERDVRALCDVGASTKVAGQGSSGYIGYKGIGFKVSMGQSCLQLLLPRCAKPRHLPGLHKEFLRCCTCSVVPYDLQSVFKVTDMPQLHSAGYHIKFDLQQDPAQGYVLPSWIDAEERQQAGEPGQGLAQHG